MTVTFVDVSVCGEFAISRLVILVWVVGLKSTSFQDSFPVEFGAVEQQDWGMHFGKSRNFIGT